MAYFGSCACGAITFSFEYDPMLQFQCHCSNCHKIFGSSINALAMPEHELEIKGDMEVHTVIGGSGNEMSQTCLTFSFDQLEFKPTMELWSGNRPSWMAKATSIIESFDDNGTVERIEGLLENLDQRE